MLLKGPLDYQENGEGSGLQAVFYLFLIYFRLFLSCPNLWAGSHVIKHNNIYITVTIHLKI